MYRDPMQNQIINLSLFSVTICNIVVYTVEILKKKKDFAVTL